MLGAEKKQEILNLTLNMKCEQCVLLGLMGMARTTQLGKHIATHYNFEHASDFSIYIHFSDSPSTVAFLPGPLCGRYP